MVFPSGNFGSLENSPFRELLDLQPELSYYSRVNEGGFNPSQRRQARDSFGEVQSQFLGQLGSQIRQGLAPTLRFDDFLEGFDLSGFLKRQPPSQRGLFAGSSVPSVRHLYF